MNEHGQQRHGHEESSGGNDRPRRGRRPGGIGSDRRGHVLTTASDRLAIEAWFAGNLVDGWFTAPPKVTVDDYEILVIGELAVPDGIEDAIRTAAEQARIERFRTDSRERRITIARDAEQRFERKVSWGAQCGGTVRLFTTLSAPMMTRLQMPARAVLDTLVDAGVARSRSDALAWCVELVGRNETEWIAKLRDALDGVAAARESGPGAS